MEQEFMSTNKAEMRFLNVYLYFIVYCNPTLLVF